MPMTTGPATPARPPPSITPARPGRIGHHPALPRSRASPPAHRGSPARRTAPRIRRRTRGGNQGKDRQHGQRQQRRAVTVCRSASAWLAAGRSPLYCAAPVIGAAAMISTAPRRTCRPRQARPAQPQRHGPRGRAVAGRPQQAQRTRQGGAADAKALGFRFAGSMARNNSATNSGATGPAARMGKGRKRSRAQAQAPHQEQRPAPCDAKAKRFDLSAPPARAAWS